MSVIAMRSLRWTEANGVLPLCASRPAAALMVHGSSPACDGFARPAIADYRELGVLVWENGSSTEAISRWVKGLARLLVSWNS